MRERVRRAIFAGGPYPKIGQFLREAAQGYVDEWKTSQKAGK